MPPALVQIRAQGIACDLHVRSVNSRQQRVTYELTVANTGDVRISCRLYGLDSSAHTREFGMLTIGKQSAGSSFFSVPLGAGEHRRMYVEVIGDGVNLFAEAAQPQSDVARWPRLAVACALSIATASAATYAFQSPSVRGAFLSKLTRPNVAGGAYQVRMAAARLHRKEVAQRDAPAKELLATDISRPAPSEFAGLEAHAGESNAAEPRLATGVAARQSGGLTRIAARLRDALRWFGGDRLGAPSAARPSEALSLPSRVIAGQTFRVLIQRASAPMRIAFEDNLKAVVDEVEVPPQGGSVTFAAPASQTAETYYLASSVRRGTVQETAIRPLRVYPPKN